MNIESFVGHIHDDDLECLEMDNYDNPDNSRRAWIHHEVEEPTWPVHYDDEE